MVTVQRKHDPDWAIAMHAFIDSRAAEPYAWGTNDCCMFVCDHIQAITGVDVGAEFRGRYTDQESASALIKEITGGTTVEDAAVYVCEKFGLIALPGVLFAGRGDIVLLDEGHGMSLGAVYLNGVDACFVGVHGLYQVNVKDCRRAWRLL